MDFYKILSEIMNEQNIGIADVSRKCNLTDSTVRSIIDRKQKKIALSVAFKLSDGLGVSLERLNGMPEKEKSPSALDGDSADMRELNRIYNLLNDEGKRRLLSHAKFLTTESDCINAAPREFKCV